LAALVKEIARIIQEFKPEALAIEKLFFVTNQKTAISVAEARGAVLAEAARARLPVFEYTPLQVKIAVTGYGRSDKRQVTEMIKKLISLPEEKSHPLGDLGTPFTKGRKRLDDEYDAIAVGLTCLASRPRTIAD
jgi:crossover junction endodeoxyribonuclease RuvC